MKDKKTTAGSDLFLRIFRATFVAVIIGFLGFYVYTGAVGENPKNPFKLGLDLAGGSRLVYEADLSKNDPAEAPALMQTLRNVIEKRINAFGVAEPAIYVETGSVVSGGEESHRLVVELPGVTDVRQAIDEIGRTPLLEFKLLDLDKALSMQNSSASTSSIPLSLETDENGETKLVGLTDEDGNLTIPTEAEPNMDDIYVETGLTGRYLERAQKNIVSSAQSGTGLMEVIVSLKFTPEGADLFADITRNNVGKSLAIFLDGEMISSPQIREAITGGEASISGNFSNAEAKELADNLSLGALPVPIHLDSVQTVGASLGQEVIDKGVTAGVIGFALTALFLTVWYRLPGLMASLALLAYVVIMLALFQKIPVTLTAAGLAGFIISMGIAVDANVLVFERIKEELRAGKSSKEAIDEAFSRAWTAIRDCNVSGVLSTLVLFWLGSAMVKGFALVFCIGIIVSMFSALVLTRIFMEVLPRVEAKDKTIWSFLINSGLSK